MERVITTTLNSDEFKELITDAVKDCLNEKSTAAGTGPDDNLMTQREAAIFLKISLPTIIRWKKLGKIPFYQVEKKPLFKKSELLKALHKNAALLR